MAAGLGFKTFTTGEVLTAADVNGYLMQGILVFASEAARNSAITSPQEGQFAFTKDNNSLWYYTGSAWAASGATGDIEGVTAGVGISGGGTSGTVTITNSMATEIDAKGDLVVGTGADTFSRLPVGTNNYVLTADSTQTTGMKWAAAAGGGKVLQVVTATLSTAGTTSSTTFVDTGLSVSITPSAASSKVLVLTTVPMAATRNSSYVGVKGALVRGSTQLSFANMIIDTTGTTLDSHHTVYSVSWLDSPSTTSSTTYKIQYALVYTASGGWLADVCPNNSNASIVALEIGA